VSAADARTVVLTGATGSLGRQAAVALGRAGGGRHLVVTGRDAAAAEKVAAVVQAESGAPVTGLPLDLTRLTDVRAFAKSVEAADLPPLEAIVCGAGIQIVTGLTLTEDGFETTFAVNHLAHFLLVRLLLPQLSGAGRIVFVSSDTHDPKRLTGMPSPAYTDGRTLAHPQGPKVNTAAAGRRRYTTSKLCNVYATYELARRLEAAGSAVTSNAFDPGMMPGTGLAREYTGIQAFGWNKLMPALTAVPFLNVHTPAESGAALAGLVTDPALAATSGRYFEVGHEAKSSVDSYDTARAAELWATSCELVGVEPEL
jgi:NAD(P)-dependent dehydrogenase (short-subunit alcohol dehydrogenase family)